jgi:hypothetical protein
VRKLTRRMSYTLQNVFWIDRRQRIRILRDVPTPPRPTNPASWQHQHTLFAPKSDLPQSESQDNVAPSPIQSMANGSEQQATHG